MIYQDCETCKDFRNCNCDDLRERQYLRKEGRDCYKEENTEANNKTAKTPSYAEIYESEDAWENRVSSYRYY